MCLCETWARYAGEFDTFLSNYVHFDSVRTFNTNCFRNSGGVSVFVKDTLFTCVNVTRIFSEFKNCIVLFVNFPPASGRDDLILYFTYVSPEGSSIYSNVDDTEQNGILLLQDNIDHVKLNYSNAMLLLAGDLNARIKDLLDYIPDDNLIHVFGDTDYCSSSFDLPRQSKDSRCNTFGRSLINMCCTHDLHVLNGRFNDHLGNFTCVSGDGASVVDYMIACENLFRYVTFFSVLNRDESDHFPISCNVKFKIPNQASNVDRGGIATNVISKYKWDLSKSRLFFEEFRNLLTQGYDNIQELINTDVNDTVSAIIQLYQKAAVQMYVRSKPSNHAGANALQPLWWNNECDILKQSKYTVLHRFRITNDSEDLSLYKRLKLEFKTLTSNRKSESQNAQRNKLIDCCKNVNQLWAVLKKSRLKQTVIDSNISLNDWFTYFSELLYDDSVGSVTVNDDGGVEDEYLNAEITLDEVINAIGKLSVGKSAGNDGISSEFYKHTSNEIAPILCSLFNRIFESHNIPIFWSQSIICPIHKSEAQNDPKTYRGISITSVMYKIFSHIMNNRLYSWAEDNNKIDESQSGFRRGYSAIDNIFCLQAITQKYLSRNGGRFYCLYIDFSKAFDKINHDKLFESLQSKGVNGKFIRTLVNMYKNLQSCVKTSSGTVTDYFPCNIGTRQGDISSPTIFSLFID